MMHIKVIKAPDLKKVAVFIAAVLALLIFILCLPFKESVQAFSAADKQGVVDDIYKIIMKKSIPALDIAMDDNKDKETSEFIAYTLFKYITKIDFANPRTYLASEIPLLDLFDIATLNGSVTGISSSKTNENTQGTDKPPENTGNFDEKPVVNPNIDPSKPAVIIYHTHTSESFTATAKYNYEMAGDYITTNNNFNVCRVGEEIKNYLETYYGLAVVHDTTVHDIPSRTGSYSKSRPTIEKLLKKYPDAQLIIDLHRDAVGVDDASKKEMIVNIREEDAAKIMFVIGKSNPHWQENYYLSSKINQKVEELYPGLTKRMYVVDKLIYNQDISNKAVLIEMGAECNTLEQTLVTAKMVAKSIGQVLKGN